MEARVNTQPGSWGTACYGRNKSTKAISSHGTSVADVTKGVGELNLDEDQTTVSVEGVTRPRLGQNGNNIGRSKEYKDRNNSHRYKSGYNDDYFGNVVGTGSYMLIRG